ncbi:hypothetical protein [Microcystis phage Mwe-JY08]
MSEEVAAPSVARDAEGRPVYRPDGSTLIGFMKSNARVRIIRGPIRSGTSSMCCMEIFRRACEQKPGPDGVRRTRWFIVRNSYPDLMQSTIKTWLAWFPEKPFGRFIWSKPMVHTLRVGDVVAEVVFLALDKPEDVSKLRSTEWTGGWFNELEYTAREIFDEAESRVGYFPAIKDGGATWSGVFGDMNAPSEDNWVVMLTGEVPLPEDMLEEDRQQYRWPEGWDYFVQPPGLIEEFGPDGKTVAGYRLNPLAENLTWIPKINGNPLYIETIKAKSKRWIDSRIMNRITAPVDGTPVLPMFVQETHVAKQPLRFISGWPVYVGLDFGRKPAAVFGQIVNDRWQIIGELSGLDEGATVFAPKVRRWLLQNCPGLVDEETDWSFEQAVKAGRLKLFGDPKGADKVQSDETTAYDVFRSFGLMVLPAPVPDNNIETRLAAWESVLNGMRDGRPRMLITPDARKLKMALAGGYCWDKGDTLRKVPNKKNGYSDLPDAGGYMLLGAGEGHVMTGRSRPGLTSAPVKTFQGRRSLRRVG